MLKVFKKIVIALVAVSCLAGCGSSSKKEHVPNENRRTANYDYDFVDFLDIKAYGPEGKGIIEVTSKKYSANDFSSENEYIRVKKAMDSLSMYYIQGENNSKSQISISKVEGLKNDDIVTIKLSDKAKYDLGGVSMCLDPYEFVVSGLGEGEEIDLFDNSSVTFYNLEGTNQIDYLINKDTSKLPPEIIDNIEYTVSSSDTTFVKDETILKASADFKKGFLDTLPEKYYNIDIYMYKHGYLYNREVETVLDEVVKPLEFNDSIIPPLENELNKMFYGKEVSYNRKTYYVDRIANVQQSVDPKGNDKYIYSVVYHASTEDGSEGIVCRNSMKIYKVKDTFVIKDASDMMYEKEESLLNPINSGTQILAQYYFVETPKETPAEETEVVMDENGEIVEEGTETENAESTEEKPAE